MGDDEYTPNAEHKLTFGASAVGNRDPFGNAE